MMRLRDLIPWIETWETEAMFAGVPGKGAEDVWWLHAASMEEATANDNSFAGGAADFFIL